jgi:hypothetical protein
MGGATFSPEGVLSGLKMTTAAGVRIDSWICILLIEGNIFLGALVGKRVDIELGKEGLPEDGSCGELLVGPKT